MRIFLFCMLLVSIRVHASLMVEDYFHSRYDQNASGSGYTPVSSNALRLGYSFTSLDLYGEYTQTNYVDGNASLMVSKVNAEYLVGLRYRLFDRRWSPFISIGAGAQQDKVVTGFNGYASESHGTPQFLSAVGIGSLFLLDPLWLGFEVRGISAKSYTPNPTLVLGGIIGAKF